MNFEMTFEETDMTFMPAFGEVTAIGSGGKGTVFIPAVSEEGVISWSNDGGLPNPEPVNIKGTDGYTPVKGTDYWTDADKREMVTAVIAALPIYDGSVV